MIAPCCFPVLSFSSLGRASLSQPPKTREISFGSLGSSARSFYRPSPGPALMAHSHAQAKPKSNSQGSQFIVIAAAERPPVALQQHTLYSFTCTKREGKIPLLIHTFIDTHTHTHVEKKDRMCDTTLALLERRRGEGRTRTRTSIPVCFNVRVCDQSVKNSHSLSLLQ